METIIQQIALNLAEKITKMAMYLKLSDIDDLASEALSECKAAARDNLEAIVANMNLEIRKDNAGRKALGLVLKEKDRNRFLLTELGTLNLSRDCYYDKCAGSYVYPLDDVIGIRKYERIRFG